VTVQVHPSDSDDCIIGGCSSELCADEQLVSACVLRPQDQCYEGATCERQPDGVCAWTPTPALEACLARFDPVKPTCFATGCSGEVCADEPVASTCEFLPEFECYRDASCERQPDGPCGWTPTPALEECLKAFRDNSDSTTFAFQP
jgi:hypothetical protein